MNHSHWTIFFLILPLLGCGEGRPGKESPQGMGPGKQYTIAVIPKGTTYDFWKSVHAGAAKAAQELGVKIIWKGPLTESDREGQINVVQDFITKRVDGICLAPLDSQALIAAVREAKAEGIPTVIFDSGLDDPQSIVSYVATDNYHGGTLAARHLGQLLNGKGNVILLRYTPGSQSSEQRERGFLETLRKEFPATKVLSENEYAGANAEAALDKAQQLLGKFAAQVDGVFTPCEHVSTGMLKALQERDLAGKVKFVGFDSSPRLVQALREKKIHGIILQDPVHMAELAVKTMVAHLKGEPVPPRVATGETLATPENIDQPAIKKLLEPEQYKE